MSAKQSTFNFPVYDEEIALLKKDVTEIKEQTVQNTVDINDLKKFRSEISKEVVAVKEEQGVLQKTVSDLQSKIDALVAGRISLFAKIVAAAAFIIYIMVLLL